MPTVAVPFVPMSLDHSPNLRSARNGVAEVSDIYLRAAYVALTSFKRWNPEWSLTLCTPTQPEGAWPRLFESAGISLHHAPFNHRPPEGYVDSFGGSLYLLDALENLPSTDCLILVDPDVVCINSLTPTSATIGALAMDYSPEHNINGLTRVQAANIHARLGESATLPIHYGGEYYCIPDSLRDSIAKRAKIAWDDSLDRYRRGDPYFPTEEHIMSYAIAGLPVREASSTIRRIWTTHRHRTVQGDEGNLAIWHLPAEKQRGFNILFNNALNRDSWYWAASREEFTRRTAKAVGLRNRTLQRLITDSIGQVSRRLGF